MGSLMGTSCPLLGNCVEAQASTLETYLRYACTWPCALLILEPLICFAGLNLHLLHHCGRVSLSGILADPASPSWCLLRYSGSFYYLPCCCPQLLACLPLWDDLLLQSYEHDVLHQEISVPLTVSSGLKSIHMM